MSILDYVTVSQYCEERAFYFQTVEGMSLIGYFNEHVLSL